MVNDSISDELRSHFSVSCLNKKRREKISNVKVSSSRYQNITLSSLLTAFGIRIMCIHTLRISDSHSCQTHNKMGRIPKEDPLCVSQG